MNDEMPGNLKEQIKVSKILSRGFIFSIVWLAGLGSLIAFVSGIQALIIIKKSKDEITGVKMAWWCIIAGLLGMVILPFIIISRK